VITFPSGPRRGGTGEAKVRKIKRINDKIGDVDDAILANPVLNLIREKHRLAAANTLDEIRLAHLRLTCGSLSPRPASTQPRPKAHDHTF